MLTLAEFCAGTGAFSLGFEKTGLVKTIYANDIEPNSKKVFDLNFNTKLDLNDIHNIDIKKIPKMDILTSGFPCQPFSIAGEKKGFTELSSRSNVFFKLLEIINHHKPLCVVLENVKNLKTHDSGNTFNKILQGIEGMNYTCKYKILNTSKITNIPQNRERIYIVCFKNKFDTEKFEFPLDIPDIIELKDFLIENVNDDFYYKENLKVWDTIKNGVVKDITTNTLYQYRRHYVRENKNNVCPTLTANMGSGGHNVPLLKDKKGIRKLTPRECFKLQGFSESYILPKISNSSLYKLAGNAVTVDVIYKLALVITGILNRLNVYLTEI